jgi:hypothetical protein
MTKTHTISKQELADVIGVSTRTLARYLNVTLYDTLVELGYNKDSNIITGRVLEHIKYYFCLQNEDFNINQ